MSDLSQYVFWWSYQFGDDCWSCNSGSLFVRSWEVWDYNRDDYDADVIAMTTATKSSQALKLRYFETMTHRPTANSVTENEDDDKDEDKGDNKYDDYYDGDVVWWYVRTNESKGGPDND